MVVSQVMAEQPSLISILLEHGLTNADALRELQARQVILGGDQQLNLMELDLVDEEQLLFALSERESLSAARPGPIPLDLQLTARVRSTGIDAVVGNGAQGPLVVSVTARSALSSASLAESVGAPFQVQVTTTLRMTEALAMFTGDELAPRITTVLDRLGPRLRLTPASRPPQGGSMPPDPQEVETVVDRLPRVAPVSASPEEPPGKLSSQGLALFTDARPHEPLAAHPSALSEQGGAFQAETAPPPIGYEDIAAFSGTPSSQVPSTESSPKRNIYRLDEAIEDLESAMDRDRIVEVVVHFASSVFDYAVAFSVVSNEARGLRASGHGATGSQVKNLTIPLDLPSAFVLCRSSNRAQVIQLRASGLEGGVSRDLKRPTGIEVFLSPVVLQKRTVVLLLCDNGGKKIPETAQRAFNELNEHVAAALKRVVLEKKRASRIPRPFDATSLVSFQPQQTGAQPAPKASLSASVKSEPVPFESALGLAPREKTHNSVEPPATQQAEAVPEQRAKHEAVTVLATPEPKRAAARADSLPISAPQSPPLAILPAPILSEVPASKSDAPSPPNSQASPSRRVSPLLTSEPAPASLQSEAPPAAVTEPAEAPAPELERNTHEPEPNSQAAETAIKPENRTPAPEAPQKSTELTTAMIRPLPTRDGPAQTRRNPAAPPQKYEDQPGLQVATVPKRALTGARSEPATDSGPDLEPGLNFTHEAPRTLKGFPKVNESKRSSASLAPEPSHRIPRASGDRPALLSRRIVPLGKGGPTPKASSKGASVSAPQPNTSFAAEEPTVEGTSEQPTKTGSPRASKTPTGDTLLSRRPDAIKEDSEPPPTSEAPRADTAQPARGVMVQRIEREERDHGPSFADLVDELIGGNEAVLSQLLEGGESAVGALIAEFPGPVREPESPSEKASDCGPVLAALVQLGSKSLPFVTVRTADENARVRRWATFVLGELPGKESAQAIANRLLDASIDVRRAALASARRVRRDQLTRRSLRSQVEQMCRDQTLDAEARCSAVEALADIREHEAIPVLLQLLEDYSPNVARSARWALCVLTRQDFRDDMDAWRRFWQEHRDEDRVEWLISSLDHDNRDIRRAAGDELRALCGKDFGYDEDQGQGERRKVQADFRVWWLETGKARLY